MKAYKQFFLRLTSIMTAVFMCGCTSHVSPDNSSDTEQTTTVTQKPEPAVDENALFDNCSISRLNLPEGLDYIQSLQYTNDSIYYSGCVENSIKNNSGCIFDTKKGTAVLTDFNINASYIDNVLLTETGAVFVYADDNYKLFLAVYDDKTGKIESEKPLDDDVIVKNMFCDEKNGQICLLEVTNSLEDETSSLSVYDMSLNLVSSAELDTSLGLKDNERAEKLINCDKGYIILTSVSDWERKLSSQYESEDKTVSYNLYKTDDKLKKEYKIDNRYESVENIFALPDQNIIVVGSKTENVGLNIYEIDHKDGKQISEISMEDVSVVYPSAGKYDMMLEKYSDDFLYGFSFDSQETEQISAFGADIDSVFSQNSVTSVNKDRILFISQAAEDSKPYMFSSDLNGKVLNKTEICQTDEESAQQTFVSDKGDIYCLSSILKEPEGQVTSQDDINDEDYLVTYYITVFSGDGKLKYTTDFSKSSDSSMPVNIKDILADEKYVYVLAQTQDADSALWQILMIDQKTKSISTVEIPDGYYSPQILMLSDKSTALSYYDEEEHIIAKIRDGAISDKLCTSKISKDYEPVLYSGTGKFSFYYKTGDVLYGWDSQQEKNKKIIDLKDQNADLDIQLICPVDDETLVCAAYDRDDCVNEKLFILTADQKTTVNDMIP